MSTTKYYQNSFEGRINTFEVFEDRGSYDTEFSVDQPSIDGGRIVIIKDDTKIYLVGRPFLYIYDDGRITANNGIFIKLPQPAPTITNTLVPLCPYDKVGIFKNSAERGQYVFLQKRKLVEKNASELKTYWNYLNTKIESKILEHSLLNYLNLL